MRRSIVCIDHSPRIGGATRMLLTALSALDLTRFRPVVVCNPGPVADEYSAHGHEVATIELPWLTFSGGPRRLVRTFVRFLRASGRIARLVRTERPAAIYAHGLASALCASVASLATGTVLVWHVHEMYDARWRMRPFVALAARGSRVVVCVSRAAADRVVGLGARRDQCEVVYNALPAALASRAADPEADWQVPGDAPVLVAIGAITPAKGHAVLIDAMHEIVMHHRRAIAVIAGEPLHAGDEAHLDGLRRRLEHLRLGDHVRFLGFRRDVPEILCRATVVVHPSTCEETFGLVPLEAMALGRPVVAARVGGIQEVVRDGETGLLVTPGDAKELARAVCELLDDPGRRERMGEEGRKRAFREFTVARMLAGLNAAFQRAIATTPFVTRDERPA